MNTIVNHNHKEYYKFIEKKYENSELFYKKKIKETENVHVFLNLYESMNTLPIYPCPIIMPIKKKAQKYDVDFTGSKYALDLTNIKANTKLLEEKIKEYRSYLGKVKEISGKKKIRRFLDYELKDNIASVTGEKNITTAWVKMFEILNTYDFFDSTNQSNDVINTFHICEHPGKFIYSIQYFIKSQTTKKHDFIFQSLRPNKNPKIFKPDVDLIKNYGDKLDYGTGNGDITDLNNILYYHEKYKHKKYQLITSDCGLDFSENFLEQEDNMYKIFFCAFLTAIGVSSDGSNYVFKFFSFNSTKSIEFLQVVCLFYETVDIVRTLSTKSGSGENYCVCRNYNYKNEKGSIEGIIKKLYNYIDNNNEEKYIVSNFDTNFLSRLYQHHNLISLRRMTNINLLIFRLRNYEYTLANEIVVDYTQLLVNYYVSYFMKYIGLYPKNGFCPIACGTKDLV